MSRPEAPEVRRAVEKRAWIFTCHSTIDRAMWVIESAQLARSSSSSFVMPNDALLQFSYSFGHVPELPRLSCRWVIGEGQAGLEFR